MAGQTVERTKWIFAGDSGGPHGIVRGMIYIDDIRLTKLMPHGAIRSGLVDDVRVYSGAVEP